jgi:hypothetical protein
MPEPIAFGKWNLHETSLDAREDPTLDDFGTLITYLRGHKRSIEWWIGDAVNYGEHNWSEEAAQVLHGDAQEMTAWSVSTLRVNQWVCERVTPETRRADLSFGHHQVVAALDTRSQRTWLARAVQGDDGVPWSVRRLTAEMHQEERGGPAATFYVIVQCKSAADQERFLERMQGEGRIAKPVTKGRGKAWHEEQSRTAQKRARKGTRKRAAARASTTRASRSRKRVARKQAARKSTRRASATRKGAAAKTRGKRKVKTTRKRGRRSASK